MIRRSNCLIWRNISGRRGNAVTARRQVEASNAGEPATTVPAATSPPIPACAYTIAPAWMVRCPESPACPASRTFFSSVVLPASPACEQMMLSSPTSQAWPTCTSPSIFAPRRTRVSPTVGAIDIGQRLNLDIVLENGWTRLRNLVVRPVGALRETETVTADHDPVLEDDPIADLAMLAHSDVRVSEEIVSDCDAFVDHHVWDEARRYGQCRRAAQPPRTRRSRRSRRSSRLQRWRLWGECPPEAAEPCRTAPEFAQNPDKDFLEARAGMGSPSTPSCTMMAAALVSLTLWAYLGLARNVI